jgi:hypothetical protein
MADLMSSFWRMVREELDELRPREYEKVIDLLVAYMDRKGSLSAPRSVVSAWTNEVNVLLSMNVLADDQGRRLLFAHQTYLDYLTAERMLRDVHGGFGTVLGWLEGDEQSLFRRGQLRQLLALLRDEDPTLYMDTIWGVLTGDNVRFHLKHLVLQMLGQVDPPLEGEVEVVLSLAEQDKWVDNVFDQVLAGREGWFDCLHARGIIASWLTEEHTWHQNLALKLIERVVESRGEVVERLLLDQEGEGREDWLEAVLWRISPVRLSPRLFDAYRQLIEQGSLALRDFIDWKVLSQSSPHRCLVLLDARLARELRRNKPTSAEYLSAWADGYDSLGASVGEVASALSRIPLETWDRLVPRLVQTFRHVGRLKTRTRRAGFDPELFNATERLRTLTRHVLVILTRAGKGIAVTSPNALWERVATLSSYGSAPINRMLARSIVAGPSDRADEAIRWLLGGASRLFCGTGNRGAVYRPAARLLRRYSGLCSDEVFSDLLSTIMDYRPDSEKRSYEARHESLVGKSDIFGKADFDLLNWNDLGLGQYLLHSVLPRRRLTAEALDRVGVLRRKFGPARPLLNKRPKHLGGTVSSTIPRERLPHLSDGHWLQIMAGKWQRRAYRSRQMGPDLIGELSVESFSSDLRQMTRLQPQRFARLAQRIPRDTDPRFIVALFSGLKDRMPPVGLKGSNEWRPVDIFEAREALHSPAEWNPASGEQIEAAVNRFGHMEHQAGFAKELCSVVRERGDETWSEGMLGRLARIAMTHPDPVTGQHTVVSIQSPNGNGNSTRQPDPIYFAMNCVRGMAAEAIQSVLFNHPEAMKLLKPALDSLVNDPHPAVRGAAIGLSLPMINLDRQEAVTLVLRACSHADDEVLRSSYLNHALRFLIVKHAERLEALVDRMIVSRLQEVARSGAGWVGVVWAHSGQWDEKARSCLAGEVTLRAGLAGALATAVAKGCENGQACEILASLLCDVDKDVRDSASGYFRSDKALNQPCAVRLSEAFVASPAMDDNVQSLLLGLEQHTGSLKPFALAILAVSDRLCGPLVSDARDPRTSRPMDAEKLAKVLLRLYEQSEGDPSGRRRCLDAWDRLMFERIGFDVLRHMDA